MTALHLLRHGRTEANERHLYCGKTDLPLSRAGAEELRSLGTQWLYPPAQAYFTSGMLRARETLEIIYGPVKSTALPGLAEYDFGEFEMHSYDELKERPEYLAWILDETGDISCPGGESRNANRERVLRGFNELLAIPCCRKSYVAVCHGGTIAVIMEHLFPNERSFYEWQPAPGRGYTLVLGEDGAHIYHTI